MSQALVSQDVLIDQAALAAARPSQVFVEAGLNVADESLTEGIGTGYGVIGYRGGKWSLRYRGNTYMLIRPDDRTVTTYIDLVVLRKAPMKSKSYYPKEAGFNPDDLDAHKRPTCSSMDGIIPDQEVMLKQSDTCALCPRNEWKMQPNGKMGRECADYIRMSVLLMPEFSALVLGEALAEPVFLKVPAASLSGLQEFGRQMEKSQFHMSMYVMRILFKPEKAWPEFRYQFVRALSDSEAKAIIQLRNDPQALRIVGQGSSVTPGPAISHGNVPAIGQAPPPSQTVAQSAVDPEKAAIAAALEAGRQARIVAIRQAETQSAPAPAPSQAPAAPFLELTANPPPPPPPPAPPQQLAATEAPTGFLAPTPAPPPSTAAPVTVAAGGFVAPAEEVIGSSPAMDAIIAAIRPK